jgi:hypothetical protein
VRQRWEANGLATTVSRRFAEGLGRGLEVKTFAWGFDRMLIDNGQELAAKRDLNSDGVQTQIVRFATRVLIT